MKYIINENTLRRILIEDSISKRDALLNMSKTFGLQKTINFIGGDLKKYIDIVYDGDLVSFYKNEPQTSAYDISKYPYNLIMVIDTLVVDSLDLPEQDGLKILGNFRYGKSESLPKIMHIKLSPVYGNGPEPVKWKVVGRTSTKNDRDLVGLGYEYFESGLSSTKKYSLKHNERLLIYNQIIDRYDLHKFDK